MLNPALDRFAHILLVIVKREITKMSISTLALQRGSAEQGRSLMKFTSNGRARIANPGSPSLSQIFPLFLCYFFLTYFESTILVHADKPHQESKDTAGTMPVTIASTQ